MGLGRHRPGPQAALALMAARQERPVGRVAAERAGVRRRLVAARERQAVAADQQAVVQGLGAAAGLRAAANSGRGLGVQRQYS